MEVEKQIPIEDYWVDFRQRSPLVRGLYPSLTTKESVNPLLMWANTPRDHIGSTMRVLPGDTQEQTFKLLIDHLPRNTILRTSVFNCTSLSTLVRDLWIPEGKRTFETLRFTIPRPNENPQGWDILWCLAACRELSVPYSLRKEVNHLRSPIADFYRALLELRFEAEEKLYLPVIEEGLRSLSNWVCGYPGVIGSPILQKAGITRGVTPKESSDLLLFILSLANHNHLLDGFILYTPGVESVSGVCTEQLYQLLGSIDRWLNYGCPLTLLLGWRGTQEDKTQLRHSHPKLYRRVTSGLKWLTEIP